MGRNYLKNRQNHDLKRKEMILNEQLAEKQKITKKQRENIYKLYDEIYQLFAEAELDNNLKENGKKYADKIRDLEFQLQENWNFEKDALKHTWWNKIPGCSCPVMDNEERFGIEKIMNCDCAIHGYLCRD
jgi:hypothetical protein